MIPLIKFLALLLAFMPALHAEPIYKVIDENGNVSYSSTPPQKNQDATEIDISAPPTESQRQAAQQRHEKNVKAADELGEDRKKQTAQKNNSQREKQPESSSDDQYYGYPYNRPRPRAIKNRPAKNTPTQRPVSPRR